MSGKRDKYKDLTPVERRTREKYYRRMRDSIGLFGSMNVMLFAFRSSWRRILKKKGLLESQWEILCAMVMIQECHNSYDGATPKDLHHLTLLSQVYCKSLCDDLFREGYLTRESRELAVKSKRYPSKLKDTAYANRGKKKQTYFYSLAGDGKNLIFLYLTTCREALDNAHDYLGELGINETYRDLALEYKRLTKWTSAPLPIQLSFKSREGKKVFRKIKDRVGSRSKDPEQYAKYNYGLNSDDISRSWKEKIRSVRAVRAEKKYWSLHWGEFLTERTKRMKAGVTLPERREAWRAYSLEHNLSFSQSDYELPS